MRRLSCVLIMAASFSGAAIALAEEENSVVVIEQPGGEHTVIVTDPQGNHIWTNDPGNLGPGGQRGSGTPIEDLIEELTAPGGGVICRNQSECPQFFPN